MTKKPENPFEISTSPKAGLAGSCQFGVNDAGTCGKSDTGLTQACSPRVPDWQLIETAPKDGTLILLFCDHRDGDPEWAIGHWSLPIGRPGPFGSYIWKLQYDVGLVAERIVTHWMPLPAPPHPTPTRKTPDRIASAGGRS